MDKLLAQSVQYNGLSSVKQVDDLTESESKIKLKLILMDNANLVSDATLYKNSIDDYKLRIKEKDEMLKSLEVKHTSFVELMDEEKNQNAK